MESMFDISCRGKVGQVPRVSVCSVTETEWNQKVTSSVCHKFQRHGQREQNGLTRRESWYKWLCCGQGSSVATAEKRI